MKLKDVVSYLIISSQKITEYALNPDNPKGKDKADMFEQHLGYTKDNYELLVRQIYNRALDAEANLQKHDKYGTRYQIDLKIQGIRDEQQEVVRTGWIVEPNSNTARLVTLYVKKRK